nr:NUDIX hydrolase [Haloactinospora alba]
MLVRDGEASGHGGLEVYLLRRAASMPFAPGAYAFPGGRVDERDTERGIPVTGPDTHHWSEELGATEPMAQGLVCAAVRETFEESGVLLAARPGAEPVADTSGPDWEEDRHALVAGTLSFARFLRDRGLVVRGDLLRSWARWITPRTEPRRYDTRFFAAALPAGCATRDVGGEADRVAWMPPAEAVERWRAGELSMLPPTVAVCGELAAHGSVRAILHARRDVRPIEPELRDTGDRCRTALPDSVEEP